MPKFVSHYIRRLEPDPNRIKVYTDGASDNRKTKTAGWAVVLLRPGYRAITKAEALSPPSNNQIAELTAAVEGVRWALQVRQPDQQIEIISDSLYVVRGITEYVPNWAYNGWMTTQEEPVLHQGLWHELHDMDNNTILWTHIKGHAGNVFNEMADRLADQARRSCIMAEGVCR